MEHETRIAITQMTSDEFLSQHPLAIIQRLLDSGADPDRVASGWMEMVKDYHRVLVADAVSHAESVPENVKKEYGF